MKQLPTIDLHGYTTDQVPDTVDRFLTQSMRKGASRVRIMTGKGSGKIKQAVIHYLKLGGFPFEEERLENGRRNEGVLVVFIGED